MADVIVHRFALDHPPAGNTAAFACLSEDERARAHRFVFERDRRRFVAARAGMRRILAGYCGVAPAALTFAYGPHGRPRLHWPASDIDFNLSHSQGTAALAISRTCAVGVDLEVAMSFDEHYRALAIRVLTPPEQADLHEAPVTERAERFLAYWTAKEAWTKLDGAGLGIEPRAIEVWCGAGRVSCEGRDAVMTPLALGAGLVATLVTRLAAHVTVIEEALDSTEKADSYYA